MNHSFPPNHPVISFYPNKSILSTIFRKAEIKSIFSLFSPILLISSKNPPSPLCSKAKIHFTYCLLFVLRFFAISAFRSRINFAPASSVCFMVRTMNNPPSRVRLMRIFPFTYPWRGQNTRQRYIFGPAENHRIFRHTRLRQ